MGLTVSLLVFPTSFFSTFLLSWRSYKQKRFIETLPLLLSQFNSCLIWGSLAASSIGVFNYGINGTELIRGNIGSMRDLIITRFLLNMTYFEPLNLFLYSWRFLRELEHESTSPALKKFYKWFSIFSIWIIPACFLLLVPWFIILNSKFLYYEARLQLKTAAIYQKRFNEVATAVDYLGPITNLISCLILGLVVHLVLKLSK
jgi:hypothetical protein